MKLKHIAYTIAGAALVGGLAHTSLYTIDEKEQVVITRFGNPISVVRKPGLNLKIPFIDQVHTYEKRVLEWDETARECPTLDKEYIRIDAYARWKIADPLKYMVALNNESGAQTRLDDIIYSAIRDVVQKNNFMEMVRYSNRKITTTEVGMGGQSIINEKIELGREKLLDEITKTCSETAKKEYGIEIIDVRIKRADLPEQVSRKVYTRMISERDRIAEKFMSEGEGESLKILGEKELKEKEILSGAYKTAREIEGRADAKAIQIYAEAYNKDPGFYEFVKTLELYETALNGNTKLILSTDAKILRMLKELPGLEEKVKEERK